MAYAVTIDFHDTLFQCDDWFQLEVRDLPSRFFSWLATQSSQVECSASASEVTSMYRELRREAIETGIEVDSIECVERICNRIDLVVDQEVVRHGVDLLMRRALNTARPQPGAEKLVRDLKSSGVKIGVISNAIHHPFLEWSLARFGLMDEFDLVLTSARAGYYKSRVELYELATELLAVPAKNTIHIGDSYRFDVVGASNAGMRTVWLNLSGGQANGVQPDLVVESLVDLAPRLIEAFGLGPSGQSGMMHAN